MARSIKRLARNDPLFGFFHWGAKLFPITNSHIYILPREIDQDLFAEAVKSVVPRFDLLRDLGAGTYEMLVTSIRTEYPITFDNVRLRQILMEKLASTEPSTSARRQLRFLLVHATDGNQTCVHLGITHDVADVKSGNVLFVNIMKEYERLSSGAPADGEVTTYKYQNISQLKPRWYLGTAGVLRFMRTQREIGRRMLARQRTQVRFGYQDLPPTQSDESGGNDFVHLVLPPSLQKGIPRAAKHFGVTVNTLFSAALARYIGKNQKGNSSLAVFTIAVSLRKLLDESFAEDFRSFMIDCMLRIPYANGVEKLLKIISEQVAAARDDRLEIELGRMESAISLFRNPLPGKVVQWIMERTQGTNILYSNPGVVEEDFSSVKEVAIFGCLVPPYDLMFLTPTVNGKLQIDAVYRKSHFPDIKLQFVDPFIRELECLIE